MAALLLAGCGSDDDGASTTTIAPGETASTTTETTTSTTTTTTTFASGASVEVWFSAADSSDCADVVAVTRTIPADADPYRAAFDALVGGPTEAEADTGLGSFFSDETSGAVKSVTLRDDGTLIVDFVDIRPLIPNASTSCGSMALRSQLDTTAFQFDEVNRTRYEIEGSCDEFGNFLQTECFDATRTGEQVSVPTNERASGSGCTPASEDDLPDGRWYGLVYEAEDDEIEFDLACWFSGTAASAAASEDGDESPPPNDYYVRNTNELLRTLEVASGTQVTWYASGDPNSDSTSDYAEWLIERADRGWQLGVWLEVEDGTVVMIDEMWVP